MTRKNDRNSKNYIRSESMHDILHITMHVRSEKQHGKAKWTHFHEDTFMKLNLRWLQLAKKQKKKSLVLSVASHDEARF